VTGTALLLRLFVAAILFVEVLAMAQQTATRTTAEEQQEQD